MKHRRELADKIYELVVESLREHLSGKRLQDAVDALPPWMAVERLILVQESIEDLRALDDARREQQHINCGHAGFCQTCYELDVQRQHAYENAVREAQWRHNKPGTA